MAKGRPRAVTLESLLAPLPPLSLQEFQACFPWGCPGRARVTRTRPESPSATWMAQGGGRPTPRFCIGACPPSAFAGTRVPLLRQSHFGSHAQRSPRSLCAGALAPARRPPAHPQTHTLTVTRPAGGAAPAGPQRPPRPCPGRTSPSGSAGTPRPSMEPQAGLRGPLPARPRRQRQVRVHNCQAHPQPPPRRVPSAT